MDHPCDPCDHPHSEQVGKREVIESESRRAPLRIAVALAAFEVEKIKVELGLSRYWVFTMETSPGNGKWETYYQRTWAPPINEAEQRYIAEWARRWRKSRELLRTQARPDGR